MARASSQARAIGALLVAWGTTFILSNLVLGGVLPAPFSYAMPLAYAVAIGASIAIALRHPRPARPRDALPLALGVAVALLLAVPLVLDRRWQTFAAFLGIPESAGWFGPAYLAFIVTSYAFPVALAMRLAWTRDATPREAAQVAAMALLVGSYMLFSHPFDAAQTEAFTMTALALALALPWLVVGARTRARLPVAVALAFAGIGFASALYHTAVATSGLPDPWGLYGITRVAGWALLAHAILRADLLGVPLPRIAVQRGTIAAAVLASFFIAAQLAQNVLSEQLGVLTGGLVAGAMLFAAAPIQRAAERLATGASPAQAPPQAPAQAQAPASRSVPISTPAAEEAYRAAVRAALADGPMTPREEEHLADVAHHLGLGPREVLRLRREAEAQAPR